MMQSVDKAFDPEGAIEMASAFQRLGVTQSDLLDPLKLMNMSMNDPEQFMKSISDMGKSLTELDEKGNIRIAPGSIRRMKKLAEAAGMSTDEFAKMSKASAELDIKMQKISFPDFATEEQKTMIANISQMKDGKIQMKVDGEMKDVNEVLQKFKGDQEGLKKFLEASQPKTQEELLLEQLTTQQSIDAGINSIANKTGLAFAGSKTGGKIREAERKIVRAGTDTINNSLDISELRRGFDDNIGALSQSLGRLASGEGSLAEVGQSLSSVFSNIKGGAVNFYEDLKKNMGEEEKKLLSSTNEFVVGLTKMAEGTYNFVKTEEKLTDVDKAISGNKTIDGKPQNLQVDMSKIKPDNNIDVFKKIETNSGLTKEQVMEMTSLSAKENLSGEIVLTVKVDTSDSESKAKLERLLQSDTQVRELLVKAITNAKTNDGRKGYLK
jgi:soluble cytochrome b562